MGPSVNYFEINFSINIEQQITWRGLKFFFQSYHPAEKETINDTEMAKNYFSTWVFRMSLNICYVIIGTNRQRLTQVVLSVHT